MRAASVKHAEYEILKGILITPFSDLEIDHLELTGGHDDKVARKRFDSAVENLRTVLYNMAEKRLKNLPKDHADHGLTIEEIRKIRRGDIA